MYLLTSLAGWSDSSQVSSPDREGVYPLDSGISDTLSIPPMEVPITPQGPHTLMPVHVYPLNQLRVAFSAARTANFAPGTLDQQIAFDQMHTNLGNMFDTTTGRFTCPAAGAYVFIFHILKLAISVPLYINLMRNEEVMVSAYANDGAPDHETASNHAVLQLFQGDQVWLRLHRGAIYGSSWKYSTFSGFLLYQDWISISKWAQKGEGHFGWFLKVTLHFIALSVTHSAIACLKDHVRLVQSQC